MILETLTVENFKRVKKAELQLADVTILVGANGSGKSSIIQAVHLACCVLRQADRVVADKTATVSVEQLDYLPTDHYQKLGHKSVWGNNTGSSASRVTLAFAGEQGPVTASCALRAARNAGISITGTVPAALSDRLRRKKAFFSAYIPGISGIPNREDKKSKKVVLKACSYGDSNVVLRNALLLLHTADPDHIRRIEHWIGEICGKVQIAVSHDDEKDFHILCNVTVDGVTRPLELIGTGYLQLIQIFSYILLFKPGVLLIDEPDIHLHPTVQERLVAVLADVAKETKSRILLTTHSPFIVRGASAGTKIYWLAEGEVESEDRQQVELLLGWGAFGKKVICYSEDSNLRWLKRLLSQWPEVDRVVALHPGTGYKHVPTAEQAALIGNALGGKLKVLVHRDRDSLTDDEVAALQSQYEAAGVRLWLPEESDLEACFCRAAYLSEVLTVPVGEIQAIIDEVLQKNSANIYAQFEKQRAAHNAELYKAGGSPPNTEVWDALQVRELRGAKGKFLMAQLRNHLKGLSDEVILRSRPSVTLADDLRLVLQELAG